ncbi:MAG: HNH endonuclease [Anaerolineae bacterium]|nr:HNH endonuclease [Anaerolineae bacterium]
MIANRQSLRADKMSIPVNNLSIEEWQWMLETYDHRCVYCGKPCETLTPDHVVPLARGGANVISNIVPACPACNQRKNARTPEEANMPFVVNVDITNQLEQLTFI